MHSISGFWPFLKEINVNILFWCYVLFKVLFLIDRKRKLCLVLCDTLAGCHFLRPIPRQQHKCNTFPPECPVWAARQPCGQGRRQRFPQLYSVVLRSLFPCWPSHKRNVYIALLSSIPKQFGVPYYAPSYIHTRYTYTCTVTSVVYFSLQCPNVTLCSCPFFPALGWTKAALALCRLLQQGFTVKLISWKS